MTGVQTCALPICTDFSIRCGSHQRHDCPGAADRPAPGGAVQRVKRPRPGREGGEKVSNANAKPVTEALIAFVKRVSEGAATAAEVEALPAVASVLLDYFSSGILDKAL